MTKESFTSSDQIARDMASGVFPTMSEATKRELAQRERIHDIALATLLIGAPGLTEATRSALARSIAMRVVATGGDPDMPDLSLCSFNYLADEMRRRGATVTPAPHGGDCEGRR